MKSLFIILIMFSLFISGCELVEEGQPQFRSTYNVMSVPVCDNGECDVMSGGGGGGKSYYLISICENAFYGTCGSPSGTDVAEVHCSNYPNLECSGLCYVTPGSEVCGLSDAGLGDCYCIGDEICHDSLGEPSSSVDCQECNPGETQSCSLPQVPYTCGQCNAGLKTCSAEGQWGGCDQVIAPVAEICDNGLDDDCDCNPDVTDSNCVYSHLECINEQCVEVDGQGFDQCSIDLDCAIPTHMECSNEECIEIPGIGVDQCSIDLDCAAPTHLECVEEQCIEVNGEGNNQCTATVDCIITHMECIGSDCVEVPGEGSNQCTIDGDCVVPVHSECDANGNCIAVEGAGSDQCSVNLDCAPQCGDGVCSPGESCSEDAVGCTDPICGSPTCWDGCGQWNVRNGLTDDGCDGDYVCNGDGGCRLRDCNIILSSWGAYAYDVDRYRLEGLDISVYLQGNADCIGSAVEFEIMEDDGLLGDDHVLVEPNDAVFEKVEVLGGGVYAAARSTWTVEHQNDGLGGYPEYYFNYFVDSDPSENDRTQGLLTVRSGATPLNCGNNDAGYECITDVNDNPRVSWFASGDEVCSYYGEKTCVSSGSGADRYWDWYVFQPGGFIVYNWDDYRWCGGPGETNPSTLFNGATDVDTRFKCV